MIDKPVQIELWNPKAGFTPLKDHNRYTVTFEITPELWRMFETPQPGLRLNGYVWAAEDDESDMQVVTEYANKSEREPAKPAKPFGQQAKLLKLSGFHNIREVRDALALPIGAEFEKQAWEALRVACGVESMGECAPDVLIEWTALNGLSNHIPRGYAS